VEVPVDTLVLVALVVIHNVLVVPVVVVEQAAEEEVTQHTHFVTRSVLAVELAAV
jgi:hypothetical protein